MQYAGTIEASSDPPGIDRDSWLRLIESHSSFIRPEPKEGINPFTQEPTIFHPSESSANLIVDGQHIGSFDWSQNEENLLTVCGELAAVREHAIQVASQLSGSFIPASEPDR